MNHAKQTISGVPAVREDRRRNGPYAYLTRAQTKPFTASGPPPYVRHARIHAGATIAIGHRNHPGTCGVHARRHATAAGKAAPCQLYRTGGVCS